MDIKAYIDDLFRYLDSFENTPAEFETAAFLQTYNGIYSVFKAFREQRNEAIDVDRYFLRKIQKSPLNSSDLRQLTVQILITFFESEADIDGQSNKSYLYCRDLRPAKRDFTYFEDTLVPLLFQPGSLNNNFKLNDFILKEISRYLNTFGRGIQENITPEQFDALATPAKFLELMRRRMTLGEDLISDRGSLEFHLLRVDAFTKLGRTDRLLDSYLTAWNYLRKTSFWDTVKSSIGRIWGKFKGAFKNARYFRLVMTQRPPAYLWYSVLIILFIILALYIPKKWQDYSQHQLLEFQQKAAEVQRGPGR